MAGKYVDLVEGNWDDRTLYAESIPHLFHFDLLYLWMLEQEKPRRARSWSDQLQGWHQLVSLLMLGEVKVVEEPIAKPFLAYTEPYGVDSVYWLEAAPDKRVGRMGVLSPTVLARPLPDFNGKTLESWQAAFADLPQRRAEVAHFAELTVRQLREGAEKGARSYRTRLADVLEHELSPARLSNDPTARPVTIRVLRSLGWARPHLTSEAPLEIDILVRQGEGDARVRTLVPRCITCNELLTQPEGAPPIVVRGDSVDVSCVNRHANAIPLADFLIWNRERRPVVLWRDEFQATLPRGAPPPRTIQGIEVHMEWNPGWVGGRAERFLRLSFPERTLEEHRLDEIYFDKLLVPGDLKGFTGLPVRPEWIDVLVDGGIRPEIDDLGTKVIYRDLALKGWPVKFLKAFGSLSIAAEPGLAVGVYPDPARVASDWQWFRLFLDGPARRDYRVNAPGTPLLPWLIEANAGLPRLLAVTDAARPQTGATFLLGRPAGDAAAPVTELKLGVDFGTSNSLVAFYPLGRGGKPESAPETLQPGALVDFVSWLALHPQAAGDEPPGDFLPPRRYRQLAEDPHLIPSGFWTLPGADDKRFLIRWDGRPPAAGAEPRSDFKWDPSSGERRAYLRELLLLSLPAVGARAAGGRRVTRMDLGFAFPLAFDHHARTDFATLLTDLGTELSTLSGMTPQFLHMSESAACMSAFGVFEHGDLFVVADMGGGTLDVALFTSGYDGKTEHYQIGSLRLAGEDGVRALAEKKGAAPRDDRMVWQIRDQIARGEARALYSRDRDARQIANRLVVYAFEFLRTMIAAYRKGTAAQSRRKIRIVLVGNGWRLPDAFADRALQLGPVKYFFEHYGKMVEELGEPELELYTGEPMGKLPSSKHLLVRGALANTTEGQLQELTDQNVKLSRLPAGRSMTFSPPSGTRKVVGWERVVGEDLAAAVTGVSDADLRKEHLRIDVHDKPPLHGDWRNVLLGAFGVAEESQIPYGSESTLRALVDIDGRLIRRGPLQAILETVWREALKK